jgi:hypothetical protein
VIACTVATVLIGAVFLPPLEPLREELSLFFNILATFAFVLGAASLLGSHYRRVRQKAKGWGYSFVCLTAFSITLVVGLFKIGSPAGISGSETAAGSPFAWIYNNIFTPCDATA